MYKFKNYKITYKFSDSITIIENITVDNIQSTSFNISWTISGDNATEYLIDLFLNEDRIDSYNTINLNYSIRNLEPCTKYKIGVSPLPMTANSSRFIDVTTSFLSKFYYNIY
jgi:hypothetical protein